MPAPVVSEVVARPVRTLVQAGPAWIVAEFVDAWIYNMSDQQYGALVALLILVFSVIQTAIENGIGKGFLRAVPPKNVPIVDNNAPPQH